jgi:hypothetical protein
MLLHSRRSLAWSLLGQARLLHTCTALCSVRTQACGLKFEHSGSCTPTRQSNKTTTKKKKEKDEEEA